MLTEAEIRTNIALARDALDRDNIASAKRLLDAILNDGASLPEGKASAAELRAHAEAARVATGHATRAHLAAEGEAIKARFAAARQFPRKPTDPSGRNI